MYHLFYHTAKTGSPKKIVVCFFFLLILGKKASFVLVPFLQEKLELSSVEKIQKIVIADKLETPLVKNKYFFKHIITGNMKCFKEKNLL